MCLYQTPGRRPTRITGRFVNTVTRGWVGAPNERAPFRFHAAVVGLSIDVCRGLGISPLRINIWLSFLRPMTMETRCPKVIFPKLFKKETGLRYARTAAMGNTGKKCLFF